MKNEKPWYVPFKYKSFDEMWRSSHKKAYIGFAL